MEGEARAEAFFRGRLLPGRRVVEPCEAPHHPDHVRTEGARVPDVLRLEEAPAQHLRHVLLLHRLHPFLALAPEHVEEPGDQLGAQRAPLLAGVGGQQRGHHRRPVHLGHGLGQGLEEVLDAVAPYRIDPRLLAGVHQHFVHQDERREPLRLRRFEELHEEGFGRRGLALFVPALAVDCAQPLRARELERQHAPGVAERARPAPRRAHALDAPLHVDLVEAERRDERARQAGADVLAELPHRGEVGQRLRVPEQVVEGDQGMGLAAAVGQLELPYRLVALPRQPPGDVPRELPQRVGRVGEREELLRLLVDRAAALPERHLVQIGGELREG